MLKELLHDFRALFRRDEVDAEVAEELRSHIAMRAEENVRSGMTRDQAEKDAVSRFGNFEEVRQTSRQIRGASLFEAFVQDVRFGGRMLLRSRHITFAAILALGLGTSAATSIFSVLNAVILRPLPYRDPTRLVWITQSLPRFHAQIVTGADYLEWAKQSRLFESVGAFSAGDVNLTGAGMPDRVSEAMISSNFLPLLGVQPAIGRIFSQEEDRPGANGVVLLSDDLWKRQFGGSSGVVGTSIALDDKPYTVIGVLPPGFQIFGKHDVWVPLALDPAVELKRGRMSLVYTIARLQPGVTREQAQSGLAVVARRLEQQFPQGYEGVQVQMLSLHDRLVSNVRPSLLVLFGAVGFLLLIACVNVANLLLARSHARGTEVALRGALGASRLRLVRQFLTESILLGFLGGTAGLVLTIWGMKFAENLIPAGVPGAGQVRIDAYVLAFALVVSLITGIAFGLVPALRTTKPDLNSLLKEGGRAAAAGLGILSFRNALAVCELALTLVLLAGAGLMIRSLAKLSAVDPGFRGEGVLTMAIKLPNAKYPQPRQQGAFLREALTRIGTLPGVGSAGTASALPMAPAKGDQVIFSREGEPPWQSEESAEHMVSELVVSPDYFRAMGISLRQGECFSNRDDLEDTGRVLINESLARQFFSGTNPVGKRLKLTFPEVTGRWLTVGGVVSDVRQQSLEDEPRPAIYIPYPQAGYMGSEWLAVRAGGDSKALTSEIRAAVASIDPNVPVYDIMTMQDRMESSGASRRFKTLLFTLFGIAALALAAVGIYGVMSYSVTRRHHEIGVRMALGASSKDVVSMILKEAATLGALGIGAGLLGAFCLTRFLSKLLYGIPAFDPLTFAGVSLFLSVIGMLASYLPARKAAAVDPTEALRHT